MLHLARVLTLAAMTFFLHGCVKRPSIELVSFKLSDDAGEQPSVSISISSSVNLTALAEQTKINVVGSMHVCGHEQEYRSIQYLHDAVTMHGEAFRYRFTHPASHEGLFSHQERVASHSGWPRRLVLESGICFQIRGGTMSELVRSNVIELPELNKQLIQ